MAPPLHVIVQSLNGNELQLSMDPGETVASVKEAICATWDLDANCVRLLANSRVPANDVELSSFAEELEMPINMTLIKVDKDTLAGGYTIDDVIFSLANYCGDDGQLKIGDCGRVLGPCNNDKLSQPDMRILCTFPNLHRVNIHTSVISSQDPCQQVLPCGFCIGDIVFCCVEYSGSDGSTAIGDEGRVLGPCNNPDLDQADARVLCSFPNMELNSLLCTISKENPLKQQLPGGLCIGDTIFSLSEYSGSGGRLAMGDVGHVKGPCNNAALANPINRVLCSFPDWDGVNVLVSTISKEDPTKAILPSAYHIGDTVFSLVAYSGSDGSMEIGDEGRVRGPCNNLDLDEAERRVLCSFPNCDAVNVLVSTISNKDPTKAILPNGYHIGDTVFSRVAFSGPDGSIGIGDEGRVRGPCNNLELDEADRRVLCTFPNIRFVNCLVRTLSRASLASHVPCV